MYLNLLLQAAQKWQTCSVGCKFGYDPDKKPDAAFGMCLMKLEQLLIAENRKKKTHKSLLHKSLLNLSKDRAATEAGAFEGIAATMDQSLMDPTSITTTISANPINLAKV
ncbi:hypothetical protein QYF36_025403 [Acer negundo]|nr:hypothetical protein QYF36_025403 [Acer negundo]